MLSRSSRRRSIVTLLLIAGASCITALAMDGCEQAPPPLTREQAAIQRPPDRMRVLFIGNSLTARNGGQDNLFNSLPTDPGQRPPFAQAVTREGQSLDGHYRKGTAVQKIREGAWDVIVLQDHSAEAIEAPDLMADAIRHFVAEAHAVGAQPVLFMTWALKQRPDRLAIIAGKYRALGDELRCPVAPVGLAFETSLRLHPDIELYEKDGRHPSPAGSFLAACVIHDTIYNHALRDNAAAMAPLPHGKSLRLPPQQSEALQQVAWQTVEALEPSIAVRSAAAAAALPAIISRKDFKAQ